MVLCFTQTCIQESFTIKFTEHRHIEANIQWKQKKSGENDFLVRANFPRCYVVVGTSVCMYVCVSVRCAVGCTSTTESLLCIAFRIWMLCQNVLFWKDIRNLYYRIVASWVSNSRMESNMEQSSPCRYVVQKPEIWQYHPHVSQEVCSTFFVTIHMKRVRFGEFEHRRRKPRTCSVFLRLVPLPQELLQLLLHHIIVYATWKLDPIHLIQSVHFMKRLTSTQ